MQVRKLLGLGLLLLLSGAMVLGQMVLGQTSPVAGWRHGRFGWTIIRPFPDAPYPAASRAHGYAYQGKFYSFAAHYDDSRVAIFIPAGYRPGSRINFIVHFHGWNNHLSRALPYYRLPQQVEDSGVNAILVLPQGPYDAPDSDDGKLTSQPGDFAGLMREVARFLHAQGRVRTTRIGAIVISSHSGGNRAASDVLQFGGLTRHITDVFLFDSAYGDLPGFLHWLEAGHHRRLVSVFTDDTSGGNLDLMAGLQAAGKPITLRTKASLTRRALARRGGVFLYTPHLPHDHIMQRRSYFQLFLATSRLPRR